MSEPVLEIISASSNLFFQSRSFSLEESKQSAGVRWYIDIMVQVLLLAGDYVAEAVWYRVVQVVTNTPDIHEYAAEKLLGTVQSKW